MGDQSYVHLKHNLAWQILLYIIFRWKTGWKVFVYVSFSLIPSFHSDYYQSFQCTQSPLGDTFCASNTPTLFVLTFNDSTWQKESGFTQIFSGSFYHHVSSKTGTDNQALDGEQTEEGREVYIDFLAVTGPDHPIWITDCARLPQEKVEFYTFFSPES